MRLLGAYSGHTYFRCDLCIRNTIRVNDRLPDRGTELNLSIRMARHSLDINGLLRDHASGIVPFSSCGLNIGFVTFNEKATDPGEPNE